MLEKYVPVAIFLLLGIGFGVVPMILGRLLGGSKPNAVKSAPYECGFVEFETARLPFDVRFYLVAILFIIFDLETAFLFPWAVVLRDVGGIGFFAMILFLLLLLVGFVYEWRKGALEWE